MNDKIIYKDTGDDGFDNFFRQSLTDHKVDPSPQVWKAVNRKLLWREILRFNFTNVTAKIWSVAAVTVVITGIGVYLAIPSIEKIEPKPVSTPLESSSVAVANTPVKNNAPVENATTTVSHINTKNYLSKPVALSKPEPELTKEVKTISTLQESREVSDTKRSIQETTIPVGTSKTRSGYGITSLKGIRTDALFLPHNPIDFDSIITLTTVRGSEKFNFPGKHIPQMLSVSIGILPEMAYYTDPDKYTKTNYWAHAGFTWHISSFSIGTGVELGYMLDQGKYKVEYKSNDSIGYFNNVVSYSTGANNEIIFNTVATTIYDSLHHADDYRTSNRFTYLRIPLLLGYRIFETNLFSVTLKAGPAFSMLLGSKKGEPVIEYSNARIIRIDENTPARMKTNWQLWADLYMEMRLNRKFSFYIEPSYKYFMKPTAEQENPDSKPPWSFGLGLGVQINFDTNK